MENIIKALDAIIEDVAGGADAEAIVADLEELKELISEQGETDDEGGSDKKKPKGDPIRDAMGLKPTVYNGKY